MCWHSYGLKFNIKLVLIAEKMIEELFVSKQGKGIEILTKHRLQTSSKYFTQGGGTVMNFSTLVWKRYSRLF